MQGGIRGMHRHLVGRTCVCLVSLAVLSLSSCRQMLPTYGPLPTAGAPSPALPTAADSLPPQAYTGVPMQAPPAMVGPNGEALPVGTPLGAPPQPEWSPPGIAGPWPQDEYLADGGDLPPFARLDDRVIRGVNMEDTVAYYSGPDGKTQVAASNRVFVYSPRFGAVRQVVSMQQDEQAVGLQGFRRGEGPQGQQFNALVASNKSYLQSVGARGRSGIGMFESRMQNGAFSSVLTPEGFANDYKAYENFNLIRFGRLGGDDLPLLAQYAEAAQIWFENQSIGVTINHQAATVDAASEGVHSVFSIESKTGTAKLRVTKVASTQAAQPGDIIDFTIRFDNVGTAVLNDIVLTDNLNTRLEFVPGSAQCSVEAEFGMQPNEEGSSALAWAIKQPLKPGEGGIIRFQCKVR
ncbi:hypothetical protein JCM19992_15450 [Thermostilla marina]